MAANCRVLVMAAGTGGHVFPALSIARCLQRKGAEVHWLATQSGMENELLQDASFPLHRITVSGLRGSGMQRKLIAPLMLIRALLQSMRVIRSVRPDCILGMGGFVCGPAGLGAKMLGVPILIHEQNAVAGLTNRILHKLSRKTFAAFPNTFPLQAKVEVTGNPVRSEIEKLHSEPRAEFDRFRALRILVLGGSQGALAINNVIPEVFVNWEGEKPEIWHQTGAKSLGATKELYESLDATESGRKCRVVAFIDDMTEAYRWADLVICRSGASTVSELAVAGLPAVLVPYPYHKDQQQLHNANWLVSAGAGLLVEQENFCSRNLMPMLLAMDNDRSMLIEMRNKARSLAKVNAAEHIADECLEYTHED